MILKKNNALLFSTVVATVLVTVNINAGDIEQHLVGAADAFTIDGNNTEHMRVTADGYVGIGTDTPDNLLSIVGTKGYKRLSSNVATAQTPLCDGDKDLTWDVATSEATEAIGFVCWDHWLHSNGVTHYWADYEVVDASYASTLAVAKTGKVGILTNKPKFNLDINGTFRTSGYTQMHDGLMAYTGPAQSEVSDDSIVHIFNSGVHNDNSGEYINGFYAQSRYSYPTMDPMRNFSSYLQGYAMPSEKKEIAFHSAVFYGIYRNAYHFLAESLYGAGNIDAYILDGGHSYFSGKMGIGTETAVSPLAVVGLPSGTTDTVADGNLTGAVCITDSGNMYIDTDGSCAN